VFFATAMHAYVYCVACGRLGMKTLYNTNRYYCNAIQCGRLTASRKWMDYKAESKLTLCPNMVPANIFSGHHEKACVGLLCSKLLSALTRAQPVVSSGRNHRITLQQIIICVNKSTASCE